MDLERLRREIVQAQQYFPYLECHPATNGSLYVLGALQTSVNRLYTFAIFFPDVYPNAMPSVYVRKPDLKSSAPHRYKDGNICYLHPKMWNPGLHTLSFVVQRAAKWLNKYEVWQATGNWPGAQLDH